MARKPAGGKAAKAPKGGKGRTKKGAIEKPEVVESTLLLPDSALVLSLAKAKLKVKKSNGSASGEVGKKIADAVENKHLDRKALGIACQLFNMHDSDPEKMALTYFHMLRYFNDLGIPEKAKAHEGMFTAAETGPGVNKGDAEDGAEDDGNAGETGGETGGNVTHIGTAARKVAQAAGEAV